MQVYIHKAILPCLWKKLREKLKNVDDKLCDKKCVYYDFLTKLHICESSKTRCLNVWLNEAFGKNQLKVCTATSQKFVHFSVANSEQIFFSSIISSLTLKSKAKNMWMYCLSTRWGLLADRMVCQLKVIGRLFGLPIRDYWQTVHKIC